MGNQTSFPPLAVVPRVHNPACLSKTCLIRKPGEGLCRDGQCSNGCPPISVISAQHPCTDETSLCISQQFNP